MTGNQIFFCIVGVIILVIIFCLALMSESEYVSGSYSDNPYKHREKKEGLTAELPDYEDFHFDPPCSCSSTEEEYKGSTTDMVYVDEFDSMASKITTPFSIDKAIRG